jgi:DNA-binding response OmpR family regulator
MPSPPELTMPPTALRVLIIEDQQDIAANIWDYLEARGFQADHAADGATGLQRALAGNHDLIVLDLGLPRLDGLELCRRLRAADPGVPVLMLTARDTLEDKLKGFAEGADDYMVKPFSMRELEARLRALHRRTQGPASVALKVGDLEYEPATMQARRGGQAVELTAAQARLLEALMRQAPAIVAHADLLRAVYGADGGDAASLHTLVYTLRTLLDRTHAHAMIRSVHGVGYRLVAEP